MSKNISFNTSSGMGYLSSILRFHYLIFILVLLGGVAYTVYEINTILNAPTDEIYKAEQTNVLLNDSFDTETIRKLKQLNYSSNPQSITLPPGRTNPFAE